MFGSSVVTCLFLNGEEKGRIAQNQEFFKLTGNKLTVMTQDERWMARFNEVKAFIETNHRNPSRHRIEEHDMFNWLKANRKLLNAGKLMAERVDLFDKLLSLAEENKHVNQWK